MQQVSANTCLSRSLGDIMLHKQMQKTAFHSDTFNFILDSI